jgi:hypothetical protein
MTLREAVVYLLTGNDALAAVELLMERHKDQIAGVLSCYDRIIIQGTIPGWCYASG